MKIRNFANFLLGPARRWPGKTFSNAEVIVVTALLLAACVGISRYVHVRFFTSAGDAASMVDLIKTVASTGWLVNPTIASANDMWPLLGALADKYCSWDFVPMFREASDLTWHAYWLTFPIAALTFIPGVTALGLAVSLVALSHVGVLWTSWLYLRRHGVPFLVTVAFCVAVFVFKPWSESISGMIYFDRLFLFPGMALVLLVHLRLTEERGSLGWIVALTLICAMISERPALMVGVFLIGYPILRRGWSLGSRDCLLMIALGLACLAYFGIYTKFVQESPYLSSWTNMAGILQNLKASLLPGGSLFPQTMKLFVVLAPFVLLSLFDWRLCLIAVGSVVPNVMVSIGGAEKYVFVTHYHMPYLPFVLAASVVGLARLWALLATRNEAEESRYGVREFALTGACAVAGIALAAYNHLLNPHDLSRTFAFNGTTESALVTAAVLPGSRNPHLDGPRAMRNFFQDVVSVIPRGSEVSAPEWAWTALVYRGGMTIDFMPFGLGKDPYMILMYDKLADGGLRLQISSFQTPDVVAQIRTCIQERVDGKYKVIKQAEFGGIIYRVYELVK